MSLDRIDLCKYYNHIGSCRKNIEDANHWHYCQYCDKYKPKRKKKLINHDTETEIIIKTLSKHGGTENEEK